jgi:hypothetical protein
MGIWYFLYLQFRHFELCFNIFAQKYVIQRWLLPNEPNPYGTKRIKFISYWIDFLFLALM